MNDIVTMTIKIPKHLHNSIKMKSENQLRSVHKQVLSDLLDLYELSPSQPRTEPIVNKSKY